MGGDGDVVSCETYNDDAEEEKADQREVEMQSYVMEWQCYSVAEV